MNTKMIDVFGSSQMLLGISLSVKLGLFQTNPKYQSSFHSTH